MMKLHKIRKKSGETLVEVVASMFIFLILFGILQGAISYSHASMEQNKKIRAQNAEIIRNLASAEQTSGSDQTLRFVATTPEMDRIGNQVFSVDLNLASKQVSYIDSKGANQIITFYTYGLTGTSETQAAGGTMQ